MGGCKNHGGGGASLLAVEVVVIAGEEAFSVKAVLWSTEAKKKKAKAAKPSVAHAIAEDEILLAF